MKYFTTDLFENNLWKLNCWDSQILFSLDEFNEPSILISKKHFRKPPTIGGSFSRKKKNFESSEKPDIWYY